MWPLWGVSLAIDCVSRTRNTHRAVKSGVRACFCPSTAPRHCLCLSPGWWVKVILVPRWPQQCGHCAHWHVKNKCFLGSPSEFIALNCPTSSISITPPPSSSLYFLVWPPHSSSFPQCICVFRSSLACYPLLVVIFLPDLCSGVEMTKLSLLTLQSFPLLGALLRMIVLMWLGYGWVKIRKDVCQKNGIIKFSFTEKDIHRKKVKGQDFFS